MGQGQLASVLRAFSATGMGQLFAPRGIPEIPPLMVCGYQLPLTECFGRCFLIRVWHLYLQPQAQPGARVGLGSAWRGGGCSRLAGARQQKEAAWILVTGVLEESWV